MHNVSRLKSSTFMDPGIMEYSRRGWEDARLGLPFDCKYDTWQLRDQINYERGRLRVANVRAAGMVPASYLKLKKSNRADGKTCHMPKILKQILHSIQAVGTFYPQQVDPSVKPANMTS